MQQISTAVINVDIQALCNFGIEIPLPGFDIVSRDLRERRRVFAAGIYEIDGVENLHRLMSVQRRDDLCNDSQVSVEEFAETPAVLNGVAPGASANEQLEPGSAKGVLYIDRQQDNSELIVSCGFQGMMKSVVRAAGSQMGRSLIRGVLGSILGGRK